MRIAFVSGKGGTGKTSVSLAVFIALSEQGQVIMADTDVEEPDCHLFLEPQEVRQYEVTEPVARVDTSRCEFSGRCSEVCRYGAIVTIPNKQVMVFDEMCNGCGACALACPNKAIYFEERLQGWVKQGKTPYGPVFWGITKVGVRSPTGVIDGVFEHLPQEGLILVDAPPGAGDAMVHAVKPADYVIVVSEPTKFGIHDANAVFKVLRQLGKPFGVIVNKSGIGDPSYPDSLREAGIPVLMEVPFSLEAAKTLAGGGSLLDVFGELAGAFRSMIEKILEEHR